MDNKKLMEVFGFNIKVERIKRKLSQEELAHRLGFSCVYISNIELGKHNISLSNAKIFADFFTKPLDYFLKENV